MNQYNIGLILHFNREICTMAKERKYYRTYFEGVYQVFRIFNSFRD